jgi:hypothetical protein
MWLQAVAPIDHPFLRAEYVLGLDGSQAAEELCHSQLKTTAELELGVGSLHLGARTGVLRVIRRGSRKRQRRQTGRVIVQKKGTVYRKNPWTSRSGGAPARTCFFHTPCLARLTASGNIVPPPVSPNTVSLPVDTYRPCPV